MSWPTVTDPAVPSRFALRRCGEFALPVVRAQTSGQVVAVFERSFYLEADGALACLGNPSIGLGPLNGILDVPPGMNWLASELRAGDRWRRATGSIFLGKRVHILCAESQPWRPDPVPGPLEPAAMSRSLERLARVCAPRLPLEGLGRLLAAETAAPAENPVLAAARAPVAGCRRWLAQVFGPRGRDYRPGPDWRRGLFGLGPGLTPSGDDFLGGIMIALHALGRPDAARVLADSVSRCPGAAENPISAAHLAVASEGQGHAAVHRIMNRVLRGDSGAFGDGLDAIDGIGHCSGWDALAGVVAGLRAWVAVQDAHSRAA